MHQHLSNQAAFQSRIRIRKNGLLLLHATTHVGWGSSNFDPQTIAATSHYRWFYGGVLGLLRLLTSQLNALSTSLQNPPENRKEKTTNPSSKWIPYGPLRIIHENRLPTPPRNCSFHLHLPLMGHGVSWRDTIKVMGFIKFMRCIKVHYFSSNSKLFPDPRHIAAARSARALGSAPRRSAAMVAAGPPWSRRRRRGNSWSRGKCHCNPWDFGFGETTGRYRVMCKPDIYTFT